MVTALSLTSIVVLFTYFTVSLSYPVYPYGPYGQYGYSPLFGIPPYLYGATPNFRSYQAAAAKFQAPAVAPESTNAIETMQKSYNGLFRALEKISHVPPQERSAPKSNENPDGLNNEEHHDNPKIWEATNDVMQQLQTNSEESSEERHRFISEEFDFNSAPEFNEESNGNNQEIRRSGMEMEDEYEQKRERDTEWDQSDYENDNWEDTNEIDEINKSPRRIDLSGDTYVNDLLAAKGAGINPDAEFIPPKSGRDWEEFVYQENPHQKQQLSYHGDTNVNNILWSQNTPINPDAEFLPPSSKYSTPIQVHYGYEIDQGSNQPIDLSRDIDVNRILAAKGAPINPNAEIFDSNYKPTNNRARGEYLGDTYINELLEKQGAKTNPDAEIINPVHRVSKPRQQGEYSGDTYVNDILARRGTPMNPDAEIFTPEQEVIEFIPLGGEEFTFEHDLRGDTYVNKIAKSRGVAKHPQAEEFDVASSKQQSGGSGK